MLYAGLPGSSWSRNQSRCCARESGRSPPRGTGVNGGRRRPPPARSARSILSARAARVEASKNSRSASSIPKVSRTRAAAWVASRECPPSAKKSSSRPIPLRPRRSAQTPASICSDGLRGAAGSPAPHSGGGSARRSTLPLGVRGEGGQDDERRGHHVGRELLLQAAAQRRRRQAGAHHVSHQTRLRAAVRPRQHHRRLHLRTPPQRRLDLLRASGCGNRAPSPGGPDGPAPPDPPSREPPPSAPGPPVRYRRHPASPHEGPARTKRQRRPDRILHIAAPPPPPPPDAQLSPSRRSPPPATRRPARTGEGLRSAGRSAPAPHRHPAHRSGGSASHRPGALRRTVGVEQTESPDSAAATTGRAPQAPAPRPSGSASAGATGPAPPPRRSSSASRNRSSDGTVSSTVTPRLETAWSRSPGSRAVSSSRTSTRPPPPAAPPGTATPGDVEALAGRRLRHHVQIPQGQLGDLRQQMVQHPLLRDHRSLRQPRRPRGEDHVRQRPGRRRHTSPQASGGSVSSSAPTSSNPRDLSPPAPRRHPAETATSPARPPPTAPAPDGGAPRDAAGPAARRPLPT